MVWIVFYRNNVFKHRGGTEVHTSVPKICPQNRNELKKTSACLPACLIRTCCWIFCFWFVSVPVPLATRFCSVEIVSTPPSTSALWTLGVHSADSFYTRPTRCCICLTGKNWRRARLFIPGTLAHVLAANKNISMCCVFDANRLCFWQRNPSQDLQIGAFHLSGALSCWKPKMVTSYAADATREKPVIPKRNLVLEINVD